MTSRYGTLLRSSRSALSSGGNPFKSAGGRPSVQSTARPPLQSTHRNPLANDTARFRPGFTSSLRIPVELGCAMSIISLHSTVVASRPTSNHVHVNFRASSALAHGIVLSSMDAKSMLWNGSCGSWGLALCIESRHPSRDLCYRLLLRVESDFANGDCMT